MLVLEPYTPTFEGRETATLSNGTRFNRAAEGWLYFGRGFHPEIGDVRVAYSMFPAQDISIIAARHGDVLTKHETSSGDSVAWVRPGVWTADELLSNARDAPHGSSLVIRLAGILIMFIALASLIPVGNVLLPRRRLLVLTIAALTWIGLCALVTAAAMVIP